MSVSQVSTRVGDDVAPLEHELPLAVEVAVEHQHAGLAGRRVVRRHQVDERHLVVAGEVGLQPAPVIGYVCDSTRRSRTLAARVAQRPGVGVVDALAQHAGIVGDERGDDVDELRQAGDADAVRSSAAGC